MWGASMCKPPRRPLAWVVVPHFSHAASGSSVALWSPRRPHSFAWLLPSCRVSQCSGKISATSREKRMHSSTQQTFTQAHTYTHTDKAWKHFCPPCDCLWSAVLRLIENSIRCRFGNNDLEILQQSWLAMECWILSHDSSKNANFSELNPQQV